jgi:hypothetical protein
VRTPQPTPNNHAETRIISTAMILLRSPARFSPEIISHGTLRILCSWKITDHD